MAVGRFVPAKTVPLTAQCLVCDDLWPDSNVLETVYPIERFVRCKMANRLGNTVHKYKYVSVYVSCGHHTKIPLTLSNEISPLDEKALMLYLLFMENTINTDNLKKARGLRSAASVAKALGISKQQLWNYENGKSEPPVAMLVKLSNLYGVTAQDLIHQGSVAKASN